MKELNLPSMTPSRILRHIIGRKIDNAEEYVYVILGRTGATGKTWVCNGLKLNGFRAFEITEGIYNLVDYTDDKNHLIVDDINKTAMIVLNNHFKGE